MLIRQKFAEKYFFKHKLDFFFVCFSLSYKGFPVYNKEIQILNSNF